MAIATIASGARVGWDAFGRESDPVMLLIQGFGAQMIGWRAGFCAALAQRGFRVVRFDNRDVGESQRYPQGGYSLADMADDTAAFLDALGIGSAHVVGQSMGGMVAQLLAQRHPQCVRSLGLIYTAASGNHYLGADEIIAGLNARALPAAREDYIPYYVTGEALCASPAYAQDLAWLAQLGGEAWDRGWDAAGVDRQLAALLAAGDRSAALPALRVPVTIIAGDGDRLIDWRASVEIHALIPGSKLKIFPGMGHELPQALWSEIADLLAHNARAAE